MKQRIRTCCCLALALFCAPRASVAEEPGLTPRPGMLLLRNGEVLSGKVARVGDLYHVTFSGGEIRVPAGEAERFCTDLEQAYRQKREELQPPSVERRLALVEWCLRQKLNGHAAEELSAALALDPRHPRIPLLQRRLKLARTLPAAAPLPTRPTAPAPTSAELDELLQTLSPAAIETFTVTVQPLLLNHCSTSGCHHATSPGELRLLRMPAGKQLTRRLTQRNLHAALECVDRENPAESVLLAMAAAAHGNLKAAPLDERHAAKLHALSAWVQMLEEQPPPQPANVLASAPLLRTMAGLRKPQEDAAEAETSAAELTDEAPTAAESAAEGEAALEEEDEDGDNAPQRGREPDRFTPVDPFDPEIFNRRFFAPQ